MSKDEAINRMNNVILSEKTVSLLDIKNYNLFFLWKWRITLIVEETRKDCKKNTKSLLSRKGETKKYCKNKKERLQKHMQNKYKELSNEENDIKRQYVRNRYEKILEFEGNIRILENWIMKNYFFIYNVKMSKTSSFTFGNIKVENLTFLCFKYPIDIYKVNIEKIS